MLSTPPAFILSQDQTLQLNYSKPALAGFINLGSQTHKLSLSSFQRSNHLSPDASFLATTSKTRLIYFFRMRLSIFSLNFLKKLFKPHPILQPTSLTKTLPVKEFGLFTPSLSDMSTDFIRSHPQKPILRSPLIV